MPNRQFELILHLLKTGKSTIPEMARRFEVSPKTIERDIMRLSSAGIPVRCQQGRGGGVILDPSYRLERSTFTPGEVEDIILAMHLLDGIRAASGNDALSKLEMVVPELAFAKRFDFCNYLHIDLMEHPVETAGDAFALINEALDAECLIEAQVEGERLTLAPLSYVLKPQGLALYCHDGARYRLVPLGAIGSCRVTSVEFDREGYTDYRVGAGETGEATSAGA